MWRKHKMVGVSSGSATVSQLIVDTDLAMGSHNITLNAGYTVDGEDLSALVKPSKMEKEVIDDLQHSKDTISSNETQAWTKKATIVFTNGIKGKIRITNDMYTSTGGGARAILTHDGATPETGSDLGSLQSEAATSYQTHSQDLDVDIPAGESIDYWHKNTTSGRVVYSRNLRFYYRNKIAVAVTGAD
jgi:hypothetical protein